MTVKLFQILWLLANNTASSPGPSKLSPKQDPGLFTRQEGPAWALL